MRKPRSREDIAFVRERALEAALTIVEREGIQALTVRRLANELGMTAGNLYNFFQGKEHILFVLLERGFAQLLAALKAEERRHREPVRRARALVERYVTWGIENKAMYELMFSPQAPKHRDQTQHDLEAISLGEHQLSLAIVELASRNLHAVCQAVGLRIRKSDHQAFLTATWALLHGLVSLEHSRNLSVIGPTATSLIRDLARRLLRLNPPAPPLS